MDRLTYILVSISLMATLSSKAQKSTDYRAYHQEMIKADQCLVSGHYKEALQVMDNVFEDYDFIFLRDYQVAAQVAAYISDKPKAFQYLRRAATAGWQLNAIKKISLFTKLKNDPAWRSFVQQYPSLHRRYLRRLDGKMRSRLKQMFLDDQRLAAENLKISDEKAQDAFIMQRFVPQNERQVRQLLDMILEKGYPGEKRIGNTLWAWTILCHHNSVSPAYITQDKLYPTLRPLLLKAIISGDLSPGDFAVIEDWRITVGSDHKKSAYGYLNPIKQNELAVSDSLRTAIGLPSVKLRNELVDIQNKTGIDLYLEGTMWIKGKIPVKAN